MVAQGFHTPPSRDMRVRVPSPLMKEHRIFVEWHDPERPTWGGYISSIGDSEFQSILIDFVERCGPPTKVEFRAHGEGWSKCRPCEDCGKDIADCHCGEHQCGRCKSWFSDKRDHCPWNHVLTDGVWLE